jgi:hypothetical protein
MGVRRKRRSSRRYQRPAALVFGLLMAGAMVACAEGALRLTGVRPAYQADLLGGWRMLPEQKSQKVVSREGASFILSTNADGMRTARPPARQALTWRVAVLGDSTVFGWGADDGATVADGMQAVLDETLGAPVEVINAAQPGYSTVQTAYFFSEIVHNYKPDLAVLFLAMHDHNGVLVSDREHLHGASTPLAALRVGLARHSRLYQVGRQWLVPLSSQAFLLPNQDAGEPRVPRVSDAERSEAADEIRATLATWGGTLALGHVPFISDLETATPMPREGDAWAAAYAAKHDLAVIDLRRCCGPDAGHLVLPHDPGHLAAEGNLAAGTYGAEQVATALRGMGAPTTPPPGYGSSR